jgi:TP901 family phage tail tape measure protein
VDVFDLFAKISLDTSEYESGLSSASSTASSFGSKVGSAISTGLKVATAAITAATTAVVAFAKSSIETGAEFDSAMSQVAATMGTTTDSIQNLRDFALEMGSQTSFSATEAAEALNYMALAGYDADTSMSMLPTVLNLAAAGSMDLATASDMVTDAQSALVLSLDETTEMVDKMAMASSKSNTSVEQLGEAFLSIGGTAQELAGGTTELSTALGILADNGIKGAEGGTHLRNIILALEAPTDTAAAAMKELGLEVFDAEGNMRPLNDILNDLNDEMSEMTSEEKTNIISTIFNKTDIASVNALLANSGERWDELSGYIDEAQGSAQAMADTQLDNLTGDVTLFKSALEGAQIVISDQLTPTLRQFVQFGSEAVSTLSTAFQEGGLSGAMDALGTILSDSLNMIISELPTFIDAGMQLLEALGKGILSNSGTIVNAAFSAVDIIATEIIANLPEIMDAGLQVIENLAQGISDNADILFDVAFEAVEVFATKIVENLPKIVETGVKLAESLASSFWEHLDEALTNSAIGDAWESIKTAASEAVNKIKESFENLKEAFQPIIDKVVEIKDKFDEYRDSGQLMEDITTAITTAIDGASTAISTVVDWLASFVEWITSGSTSADVFLSVVAGIAAAFATYLTVTTALTVAHKALAVAQGVVKAAQAALNVVMNANPFGVVALAVVAVVTALVTLWNTNEGFRDAVTSAWEAIKSTAEDVFNAVAGFFTETIPNALQSMKDSVTDKLSSIKDDFTSKFAEIKTNTTNIYENIVSTASKQMENMKTKVTTGLTNVANAFSTKFAAIKSSLTTAFLDIVDTASEKMSDMSTKIGTALSNISETFSSKFSDVKSTVTGAIENVNSTISSGLSSALSTATSALSSMASNFSSQFSSIKNTVSTQMSSLSTSLTSTMSNIVSTASSKVAAIKNTFLSLPNTLSSLPSQFYTIGSNIVSGIWNGISAGWSWLKSKVSSLATSLLSSAKSALGIASPSKAFRDQIGAMIPAGMAIGIENETDTAIDAIEAMNKQVLEAAQAATYDFGTVTVGATDSVLGSAASNAQYNSFGTVNININGANYTNEKSLAEAISYELQRMTARRYAALA